jgi:hypothetical protein
MIFDEIPACTGLEGTADIVWRHMPGEHHTGQVRVLLVQKKNEANPASIRQGNIHENQINLQSRNFFESLLCRLCYVNDIQMPPLAQYALERLSKDGMIFDKEN